LEQAMQKEINQTESDEEMAKQKLDRELDDELEATFPASDSLKITRTDSLTRFSRQNRRI
jgi:hypothetical protein